jgi:Na+/H+ antiporter NhaA
MPFGALQRLFRHEAASGIVLMLASAAALANSPFAGLHDLLLGVVGAGVLGLAAAGTRMDSGRGV